MAPSFVAAGAVASGTTTCTPALPAGVIRDDILIDIAESVGGQNITLPGGWAHITGSPVVETTNTQLTVIWKRMVTGDTAPALAGTVDHVIGRMIALRGCPLSGNPWHVVTPTSSATSSTAASSLGVTTTVADTLVLEIIGEGADVNPAGTNQLTMTNAGLTSLTEQVDNNDPTGNGGVIGCYTGIKATAGATGASAWTLATAATKAMMTVAFASAPRRPDAYTTPNSFVPIAQSYQ